MSKLTLVVVALLPAAQSLVVATAARPAFFVAYRCAPPRAQLGDGESYVNFDDSGDECLISDHGSTCMDADVASPIRIGALDEGRRSRSPPTEMVPFSFESPTAKQTEQPFEEAAGSGAHVDRLDEEISATPMRKPPGMVPFGERVSGTISVGASSPAVSPSLVPTRSSSDFKWPGPISVP